MQSLDAEYAAYLRPGTYLGLLDGALVREMFATYSLALGVSRWKRIRRLSPHETLKYRNVNRDHIYWNGTKPFMEGEQWHVCVSAGTPKMVEVHLPNRLSLFGMNTFIAGPYRMLSFRGHNRAAEFWWFDYLGNPVAKQIVPNCFRIEDSSQGSIVIMTYSEHYCEMIMELDLVEKKSGCSLM